MKLDEFLEQIAIEFRTNEQNYPFDRKTYEKERDDWLTVDKYNNIFRYSYRRWWIKDYRDPEAYCLFYVDKNTEEVFLEKPKDWSMTKGSENTKFEFLPPVGGTPMEQAYKKFKELGYDLEVEITEEVEEDAVISLANLKDVSQEI